jgi:small-conductance mechanosensitive channel
MKLGQRSVLLALLALFGAVGAGLLLTRPEPQATPRARAAAAASVAFDQRQLENAQALAATADDEREQGVARATVAFADQELDLAFATALRQAAAASTEPSDRAKELAQRVTDAENSVASDKAAVEQLTGMSARASGARKAQLDAEVELAKSLEVLSEEQLGDAKDDAARAGGDAAGQVRRLMAAHEAQEHATTSAPAPGAAATSAAPGGPSALQQMEVAGNTLALLRAANTLRAHEAELRQAQQNALGPLAALSRQHNALEHKNDAGEDAAAPVGPGASATSSSVTPAADTASATQASGPSATQAALLAIQQRTDDQRAMAEFDKRGDLQQQLAKAYGRWGDLVAARLRAVLHRLLWSLLLVLLIVACVFAVEMVLDHFFAKVDPGRRGLHTAHEITRYSVRFAGLLIFFLVFFGPPSQLATVIALAGAGLTVVLKDFIVGFFGWLMLQGRNGIRVGDWVEINGVSGEVMEVGPFHTLLLETGDWSDGDSPTGRQVKFVNSYAIEGHYFNFTTSGRWLWDELEIVVPTGTDPFPIADQIQKLAQRESEANMRLAEEDWQRTSGRPQRGFPTMPNVVVKPDPAGSKISVRYLTQAKDRNALSARLYREMTELLRGKAIEPQVTDATEPGKGIGIVPARPPKG